MKTEKRRVSNPLYVVKNQGRDVEKLSGAQGLLGLLFQPQKFKDFANYLWSTLLAELVAKFGGVATLNYLEKLLAKWIEDWKIVWDNSLALGKMVMGAR